MFISYYLFIEIVLLNLNKNVISMRIQAGLEPASKKSRMLSDLLTRHYGFLFFFLPVVLD